MSTLAEAAQEARLFSHRPFLLHILGRGFSRFAAQMAVVAMGWQVYALTDSAFMLGMVGLAQFTPMALLTFLAGHAADRYDRQRVVQICQIAQGLTAALLAWGSWEGWLTPGAIFAAVALFGTAAAFESPASAALLPGVAPRGSLQRATAISTATFQMAVICGPALSGFLYAAGPAFPYAVMAVFWVIGGFLNGAIVAPRENAGRQPPRLADLFAGIGFVRAHPAILGTISLDLFAVLLGGATALLPIFARDVLEIGPLGLGILRGCPAIGALAMTFVLARHSLRARVGRRMFQAVIVFGVATVVFGLSRTVWLSGVALAVMGAADTISVVIRTSLVQLQTPDDMRGRVGAVNFLFINASNQLGEFESGVTAALFGAVPAVLIGGIGTVVVAALWMRLFPSLRDLERLE
ncbi:MAG: MFS transporter [Rhodovulum sulfidophilum]|uniref:MFS transporter n=1 Tax=Rhodovulum sulfidophilum TaxID=35806 RepID=A0A2W5NCU1_RHOSU|nr:MAG: MFS transporter [Rhodovulum sulfidophilum]